MRAAGHAHLSRPTLYGYFQRYGITHLPFTEDGQNPLKKKSKDSPIGYLPVYFASWPKLKPKTPDRMAVRFSQAALRAGN